MTELVIAEALPVRSPEGERWRAGLDLVGSWLRSVMGNTRTTYADAIGWPRYLNDVAERPGQEPHRAGDSRETSTLRNGVTWLHWCAGRGLQLLDATRDDVIDWTEDLREAPHPETGELLSHTTRAHCFTVASSFYRWAVEDGHTTVNPLLLVKRKNLGVELPKNPSPTRSLSKQEVAQLQRAADNDPVEAVRLRSSALVAMLYRLGMRVSELINANTDDIERQGGVRVLWVTLKGGRRHAYKIPMEVGARLDRYLAARGVGTTVAIRGQAGGTSVPLFATASGGRMDRGDTTDLLQRLAGVGEIDEPKSVTPHTARHSLVTALRQAGVPDDKIRRFVGHLYASTTDRYGHHVLDLVNSPADIADELFEQELLALASHN
jgi:integrase/recombinase XerD